MSRVTLRTAPIQQTEAQPPRWSPEWREWSCVKPRLWHSGRHCQPYRPNGSQLEKDHPVISMLSLHPPNKKTIRRRRGVQSRPSRAVLTMVKFLRDLRHLSSGHRYLSDPRVRSNSPIVVPGIRPIMLRSAPAHFRDVEKPKH